MDPLFFLTSSIVRMFSGSLQILKKIVFFVNEQFPVQNRKFDRVYLAPFSSYAVHVRAFDGTLVPYRPAKFGARSCNGYRDIALERFFFEGV
jgi:hypothetical protein